MAIRVVVQEGAPLFISLVFAGGAGAATSYIPLKIIGNAFARQITAAVAGQITSRMAQTGFSSLFHSKVKKPGTGDEENLIGINADDGDKPDKISPEDIVAVAFSDYPSQ